MIAVKNLLKALYLTVPASFLFAWLNVPLPWTLGPIAAVSLYTLYTGKRIYWPIRIRNTALILLGYAMGRPLTPEAGLRIMEQLPLMLLATFFTVVAGIAVGYLTYKKTGISLTSCLLGCVPGGLSQMVILAEELKDADQTAVTIMQTVRMLSVVFSVPFLALHVLHDGDPALASAAAHVEVTASWIVPACAAAAISGAFAARWLRMPTPFLLGPLLGTGLFVLLSGVRAPLAPPFWIAVAQICVGTYIGASINLRKVKQYHGLLPCLFAGVAIVLLVSAITAYLVVHSTGASFVTAFLSTAPGGIAEMGITALVVGADIATMTAYQLVRLLFIMLCFPPLVKWLLRLGAKEA